MKTFLSPLLGWLLAAGSLLSAAPLGTAFTYQGRLFDQNTLANGPYELRLGLYDAATAGTRIGPLLTNAPVAVSNGVFTVTLDFGANAFGNTARWLELAVRPGGSTAAFALLDGRQPLTPVPQSLYAASAGSAATAASLAATAVVPGAVPWQPVAGTAQTAQPNKGYLLTNPAPVTVTLPATPRVGDVVRVVGAGAGGWTVAPAAGQSIQGATNWISREPATTWTSVASSADGRKLIASEAGGRLWVSADGGNTWTPRGISAGWSCVASSADGTKLVAAVGSGPNSGYSGPIFTSKDSGATWTARTENLPWTSVASSADGTKLVAAEQDGQIFTSGDSGVTWVMRGNLIWPTGVASSADGRRLMASTAAGSVFISTDSGVTWTEVVTPAGPHPTCVGSSSDGTRLVVGGVNGLFQSRDGGLNWESILGEATASVASSADGTHLIAAAGDKGVVSSSDAGVTWRQQLGGLGWSGVAISANGLASAAVAYRGRIWSYNYFLSGGMGAAAELQYVGDNRWMPVLDTLDRSVTTSKLADGSVTAVKLADNSVTAAKLASDSSSLNRVSGGLVSVANNRVGIGMTEPQSALHVRPSAGFGEALTLGGNSSSGGFTSLGLGIGAEKGGHGFIQAVKFSGSAFGDLALNPSGGNVYVGKDIYVSGYLKAMFGGAYYTLDKAAGAAIWSSSDQRLKQDIVEIPDALATIQKLRGVTYHWNQPGLDHLSRDIEERWESATGTPEDNRKLWEEKRREADAENSKLQVGFVAQEVEAVFPDWVKTGEDGYKQIDMSRLNAVLVNAIHEQQAQIQDQARRLAALERRLESLMAPAAERRSAAGAGED